MQEPITHTQSIRFPAMVYEQVHARARVNQRSLNGEVIYLLSLALQSEPKDYEGFSKVYESAQVHTQSIRFPDAVYKHIRSRLGETHQSFNREVVFLLISAIDEQVRKDLIIQEMMRSAHSPRTD